MSVNTFAIVFPNSFMRPRQDSNLRLATTVLRSVDYNGYSDDLALPSELLGLMPTDYPQSAKGETHYALV